MSTLLNGLVAYWKLDEESAGSAPVTREDSGPSGIDLTDFNTVASRVAFRRSPDFVRAENTYLRHSGFALDISNSWSLSCFVNIDDKTADHDLIDIRRNNPFNEGAFLLNYGIGVDRFVVFSQQASGVGNTTLVSSANATIGSWRHVFVSFDAATSGLRIRVDDSIQDSITVPSLHNPTQKDITMGGIVRSDFQRYVDGRVDEVGIWNRVLTADEITEIRNGGIGNQYPFGGNTTITHEIRPAGGGDFTSLSAWESDQNRSLATFHESARALCFGGNLGVVTLDGWNPASGNRIIIEGDDTAAHSGVMSTSSSPAGSELHSSWRNRRLLRNLQQRGHRGEQQLPHRRSEHDLQQHQWWQHSEGRQDGDFEHGGRHRRASKHSFRRHEFPGNQQEPEGSASDGRFGLDSSRCGSFWSRSDRRHPRGQPFGRRL